MPKLPRLTSKKVIKILEERGFELVRVKGSHHIFTNSKNGKIVTVPVHAKDLPIGTLVSVLNMAGIDRGDIKK